MTILPDLLTVVERRYGGNIAMTVNKNGRAASLAGLLNRISVRKKIFFGFLFVLTILAGIGALSFLSFTNVARDVDI